MVIQQIEAYPVNLRYREPFRIAPGTTTESHNIIVKVLTDHKTVGYGESSPSERVTGENANTVLRTLDRISPNLIGMNPRRIERNNELMDSKVKGNPSAKAAIDMALHDILGRAVGQPLFILMGGYRDRVLTDITLSIKPPAKMAAEAAVAVKEGFRALKVKLGVDPADDFERIRLIRETVGEDVKIRVDANQGWTPNQAIEVLSKIDKFNIQFAEQPVPAGDLKGLVKVRRDSPIPVMADESVHSSEDVLRLVQAEAVDLINIKLMKCGGILKGRRIAAVAEAAKIPCMIGCMGESRIGISAGAHLAAAVKNIQFADLDSDLLLEDRLVKRGGVDVDESARIFSKQDGLGIMELDEKLLGKPKRIYN